MFATLGEDCQVQENVILGLKYRDGCAETVIGDHATIRAFTIIYADVVIGDHFTTGHHVMIRENTRFGDRIVVGSGTIIDGTVTIGNRVKIESQVYIPTHTTIGDDVFIGPNVTMTNDMYPQRKRDEYRPRGPIIEDSVSVGANATILPGVRIGEGSFIAAGSVVTRDVPAWSLVKGVPGQVSPLPEHLRERNRALKW
jgi:acetyltransferase-like isoleucine patch superfamily enzyme